METIEEGDVMVDEKLATEHGGGEWLDLKPFPNEHAARLKAPGAYKRFRRENDKFAKGIHAIWGVRKDDNKVELQAIRFDKTKFSVAQARAWLKDHDYKPILFEPASEGDSAMASNELAFTSEQVQALAASIDAESYPRGSMSYRAYPLDLKGDVVSEEGIFEGYGAAFGNRDSYDDIIIEGAFADSIRRHNGRGPTVKMLWQHDPTQPIGTWTDMSEDNKGLRVIGKLELEVQRAREAYILMRAKALDGLSIGYMTKKYERDEETGIRKLLVIDLWETSPVTFPANTRARVRRVKSARELEEALRDAGFSKREATAFASHGFQGVCQRDSGIDMKALDALAEGIAELRRILQG